MIEAMKIARSAAEGRECWAQSFVRRRPKREVGMSNERTSRLDRLKTQSLRLCRISANLMITDPNISCVNHFDDPTCCSQIHHFIFKNALS